MHRVMWVVVGTFGLGGCDTLKGGTCRSDYACIDFDDSVGNRRGNEVCGFLTNDLANGDLGVSTSWTPLAKQCPDDDDVVYSCPFGENLYQTSGVIHYRATQWTEETAAFDCEFRTAGDTTWQYVTEPTQGL